MRLKPFAHCTIVRNVLPAPVKAVSHRALTSHLSFLRLSSSFKFLASV